MATKSTSSKKKTTGKSTAKSSARSSRTKKTTTSTRRTKAEQQRLEKIKQNRNIAVIVLAAVSVLLFALAVVPGQQIWTLLRQFYFGMFGLFAYLLPFFLGFTAYRIQIGDPQTPVKGKLWELLLSTVLVCSILQLFLLENYAGEGFFGLIGSLYTSGMNRAGGGVMSILGFLLLQVLGRIPAMIVLLVVLVASLLLMWGVTLPEAWLHIKRPVQKMEDHYAKAREEHLRREAQREAEREEAEKRRLAEAPSPSFDIDIPLDGDRSASSATTPPWEMPAASKPLKEEPSSMQELDPDEIFARTNSSAPSGSRFFELVKHPEETLQEVDHAEKESSMLDELVQRAIPRSEPLSPDADVLETLAGDETKKTEEQLQSASFEQEANEAIFAPMPEETKPDVPELSEEELFGDEPMPEEVVRQGGAVTKPGASTKQTVSKEETAVSAQEIQQAVEEQPVVPVYHKPPLSLLAAPKNTANRDTSEELRTNAELLVNTLKSFGVQTRIVDISRGPTVTRYELQPSVGVKISKITGLADDIALNLAAAGVRIEAPIPNKAAVGIEVPNKTSESVTIREVIDSDVFRQAKAPLTVALGRDISGHEVICDLSKMPHLLIAGATGSGKSVCINTLIISLLYHSTPDEVRLLMIDPKVVELGVYNGIPHLLVPVVTDPRKAAGALGWACTEMMQRYKIFADAGVRNIIGLNKLAETRDDIQKMPRIVVIIDELADLMMVASKEVEDSICRLAQLARAAGIHLVIATQRPSVDVITGLIKANIPSRIAFAVSSSVDSRTILDTGGAEKLLGRGDMLFSPMGASKPTRVQGCFVDDKEVEDVVEFIKNGENSTAYDHQILDEIERQAVQEKGKKDSNDDGGGFSDEDELLPQAIELVVDAGQASTSYLQRRLKVGYARAARLIDDMEAKGVIGPFEGSKPRQVLMTRQQWMEMRMNQGDAPKE
jgi:S-DNA-T family DNA segregation ATPase FtsK/SpoIIIE